MTLNLPIKIKVILLKEAINTSPRSRDFAITKLSSSYIEFEVSWQVNSSVPSSISNLEVHIHRLGESHELVTFRKGDVQGISRIHRRANCGDLSERENFEAIVSYEELLEYPTHVHTRQDLIRQRNILAYKEDEWAWERIELTGARDQMEQERNQMEQERDQMEQERNQMEQDRNELEQQHLQFKVN
uniref:Uncharacterized protein n=1 Tax=Ditylenchus dipsaci TaxID=166011 RepID=A0A915ESM1_9BILA